MPEDRVVYMFNHGSLGITRIGFPTAVWAPIGSIRVSTYIDPRLSAFMSASMGVYWRLSASIGASIGVYRRLSAPICAYLRLSAPTCDAICAYLCLSVAWKRSWICLRKCSKAIFKTLSKMHPETPPELLWNRIWDMHPGIV